MSREGFGVVAVRLDGLAAALGSTGLRSMSEAAAYTQKDTALKLLVRTVGPDRRMSRFGKGRSRGRVRGGVGYDYAGAGTTIVKYRPAGYWALLEAGADPHPIPTKAVRRGQRRRLLIDGQVVTGPVDHPGTRPKAVLTRAAADAERRIPAAVEDALTDLVDKLMGA